MRRLAFRPWLRSGFSVWLVLVPLLLLGTPTRAEELGPDAFAYGIRMSARSSSSVQTALLPDAVYRGSVGPDLSDLRVFNADGERLAHAVRSLPIAADPSPTPLTVPFFPWPEAGVTSAEATTVDATGATALHIERDRHGTVVDLRIEPRPQASQAGVSDHSRERPLPEAYLVDLRGVEADVSRVTLRFGEGQGDYRLPVTIDSSQDLHRFQNARARYTLVRLDHAGRRVEHDSIPLPAVRAPFLRIRLGTRPPAALEEVTVHVAGEGAPTPTRTLTLTGQVVAGRPGVYRFDAGGAVPVDGLRLRLPQDNTVVAGALSTRPALDAADRTVYRGTFHRLTDGGEVLESQRLSIERQRSRYWFLTLDDAGAGLGEGLPSLELSRVPDQLLFVARGQGPFTLAYGHRALATGALAPEQLLAVLPAADRARLPAETVELAKPEVLAGSAALTKPPDLRAYVLWGVLVLGVIGLLAVALKLARESS